MLAARIRLGAKLIDPNAIPSFSFVHNHGKITLNISIDLDSKAFVIADDHDHTHDPVVRRDFRDATIGIALLRPQNLDLIQLDQVDPAEDSTTFRITATVDTKIPGTGGDAADFVAKQTKVTGELHATTGK